MALFLEINGQPFEVDPIEAEEVVFAVAAGETTEGGLELWLMERCGFHLR